MAVNTFNTTMPKLYITAETESAQDFDQECLKQWQEEGFDVTYIPMGAGGSAYSQHLKAIPDTIPLGDNFGIIAFGDAAAVALELFRQPNHKLCCLIAYYPTSIPDPSHQYPPSVKVLVHLAGQAVGVYRYPEVLGIQGKKRTVSKKLPKGTEAGGLLNLGYPSYKYADVDPGFAEHDLEEYDKVAARLSWGRSLDAVRKAFGAEADLERIWEEHTELEFVTRDAEKTLETMISNPYVNHVPTLAGGIWKKDLLRFYADFFIPANPPSIKLKLLSRTIGADRVVDEMYVTFKHTQEMPWMLPGVPATNKDVEVALVSVVCIRGGKLYHEHIYWDQASVLVQLGLIDPMYIPATFKGKVERLPVAGRESARKVLDEDSEPSNKLIPNW